MTDIQVFIAAILAFLAAVSSQPAAREGLALLLTAPAQTEPAAFQVDSDAEPLM